MAFWDDLGNTITKISGSIVREVKDQTGAFSLSADNAASERRLRGLYADLGRLFAEDGLDEVGLSEVEAILKEDPAPETRAVTLYNWKEIYKKYRQILLEKEQITKNRSKINEMKGSLVCPGCGEVITKKSAFCPNCGTKLEWAQKIEEEFVDGEYVEVKVQETVETPAAEEPAGEKTAAEDSVEEKPAAEKPAGEESSAAKPE